MHTPSHVKLSVAICAMSVLFPVQDVSAFLTPAASGHRNPPLAPRSPTSDPTALAVSTEGDPDRCKIRNDVEQQFNRKDAVRSLNAWTLGATAGATWAALTMGGSRANSPSVPDLAPMAASSSDGPVEGAVVRKSVPELRFEMLKKGLDLTHAFQFEEAEDVYTELIGLFDSDYTSLSDQEKQLVAKYVVEVHARGV